MNDFLNNLRAVGARLASERTRLRMKQDEFAEMGGVRRVSQSQYEGGKSHFGIDYLLRLEAHGVDIGFIVTGRPSEARVEAPTDPRHISDLVGQLPANVRGPLLDLLVQIAGPAASPDRQQLTLHDRQQDYRAEG
jgi:transcriptional regulator with XRE-family HTH domain